MKKILLALMLLPLSVLATNYSIVYKSRHPAVEFSVQELKTFLNAENGFVFTDRNSSADWEIRLKRNSSLPECAFAVKCYQNVNKNEAKDYICKPEKFIRTLSSEKYLTEAGGK